MKISKQSPDLSIFLFYCKCVWQTHCHISKK